MDYTFKAYKDLQDAYRYLVLDAKSNPHNRYYAFLYTKIRKEIITNLSEVDTASISIQNNLPVMKINPNYFSGKCTCDEPDFNVNKLKPQQLLTLLQHTAITGKPLSICCFNCKKYEHELTVEERVALLIHEMQHITHNQIVRSKNLYESIRSEFGFNKPKEELLKGYEAWVENNDTDALADFIIRKEQFKAKANILNIAMDAAINQYNINLPRNFIDYRMIKNAVPHSAFEEYYRLLLLMSENDSGDGDSNDDEGGFNLFDSSDHLFLNDPQNADFVKKTLSNLLQSITKNLSLNEMPPEVIEFLEQLKLQNPNLWKQKLRNWTKSSHKVMKTYVPFRESRSFNGIFPSLSRGYSLDIDIFADVSGSIYDEQYIRFMEQVLTIQKHIPSKIKVHQWDTSIHHTEVLNNAPPKLIRYTRGGTNVQCVKDYAVSKGLRNIIILTDGGFKDVDFGSINVLWAYTKEHLAHKGHSIILDI